MGSVKLILLAVIVGIAFATCGGLGAPAYANHLVYLPGVPNTPLMQTIKNTQTTTWCMDSRAASYPNFASQLRDVYTQYTVREGIRNVEVAFNDPACRVRHTMPANLDCVGWAAHIFYANYVVDIEYCAKLGYTDWRSAQGHELGHGMLGLHEQYNDSSGSISCTGRQDTVMDCGSGVRYPTALDTQRGCALYLTTWCGKDATVTCVTVPAGAEGYDTCVNRYFFADGQSYEPLTGDWWNKDGTTEWSKCDQFGRRFSHYLWRASGGRVVAWFEGGKQAGYIDVARGYGVYAGAC